MSDLKQRILVACAFAVSSLCAADPQPAAKYAASPTMAEVMKASTPSDWRPLDPQNTLYLELPAGRVVMCSPSWIHAF